MGKFCIEVCFEKYCISKIESLYDEWTLQRHAGRNTLSHKKQKELFISKLNNLFQVTHAGALKIIKFETDSLFLINQKKKKKGRSGCMYGIDYTNMQKERLSMEQTNKALLKEEVFFL